MSKPTKPAAPFNEAEARAQRLKVALKANMGKRKAQARARADKGDTAGSAATGKNKPASDK